MEGEQTYDEIASPNNYAWAFESGLTAFVIKLYVFYLVWSNTKTLKPSLILCVKKKYSKELCTLSWYHQQTHMKQTACKSTGGKAP